MDTTIGFAIAGQEDELNSILTEHDMGLAGEINEHVVLMADGKVLGGGLLWQMDEDAFHLLVLGVRQDGRGRGFGSRLLSEISANPWRYCRDAADRVGDSYRITTVARGEAVLFYQKCGFRICDPSEISSPFGDQCGDCPEQAVCSPETMMLTGVIALPDERKKF